MPLQISEHQIPKFATTCLPSLANYKDELIFLTGGFTIGITNLKKAKVYDIKSNSWSNAPPLNYARNYHSCCALANYIYVVCGG